MKTLQTERLQIRPMVAVQDAPFMLRLLNEPSWLRFIGDRGVRTLAQAQAYIEQGPVAMYASHGHGFCVVELRGQQQPLGICGLAQRDYLDSPDIGFAFLPEYCGQGYAFEAARAVLAHGQEALGLRRVLATTRAENLESQKLLGKLGLRFDRLIPHPDGSRELLLFATEASPDSVSSAHA